VIADLPLVAATLVVALASILARRAFTAVAFLKA
jgi:hypothetical protein